MKEDNIILFQKYVDGALTDQERKTVLDRLASDTVFKSEFELFQMMEGHLEEKVKHSESLETIKRIGEKHKKEADRKRSMVRLKRFGLIAATLLLFGFITSYYFSDVFQQEKVSFAELYVEPNWQITKGENEGLSKALVDGLGGNVEKSMNAIRALDLSDSEKSYWIGEVYLKNKKYKEALASFSGVVAKDKVQRDRVNYLRVLCFHLLDDMSSRDLAISQTPDDTDDFYERYYLKFR